MRASPDLRMGIELIFLLREFCSLLTCWPGIENSCITESRCDARRVPESGQFLGPHRCTWCRAHICRWFAKVDRGPWLRAARRWHPGGGREQWHHRLDSRALCRLEFPIHAGQPAPVTRMLHSIPRRPFARATNLLWPELFVSLELDPCP